MNNLTFHRLTPILLMFAVLAFEMSTDLYLPCLPEMGRYFAVSDAAVQTTLSGYLFGFASLGLIAGPLSDNIGRRPVILACLAIFALGSIACWLSPSMTSLIAARFIQGVGAGMSMVVSTAILKDIYDEIDFSRIHSTMGIVIALSPMIAPIIGGKIASVWGWKSCFFIIALIASSIWLAIVICLRESLSPEYRAIHKHTFSGKHLLKTYGQLLKRREIVTFALISATTLGGLWAWIVEAPFYLINELGIDSVDYGYYAAVGPGAYILGTILNRRCVNFYGVERMLAIGLWLMILGAAFTLLAAIYFPSSLIALFVPFVFYCTGLAPVFANAVTKAVSVIPAERGGASALLTMFEMGISSLCAFTVSLLSNGTLVPCTIMMLASGIICAIMFMSASRLTSNFTKDTQAISTPYKS
jgi:MFS transporter, DHA1 family, multidrug resistance protein